MGKKQSNPNPPAGHSHIEEHISLLGRNVKDKITGVEGIVDSVAFDLYGCVQASINAGLTKDGAFKEHRWFDVSRLTVFKTKRVMEVPDFITGTIAEGEHGPAWKN